MNDSRVGLTDETRSDPIRIGIGEYSVVTSPTKLATYGLGSCLAISLYDESEAVGGMIHVMLPEAPTDEYTTGFDTLDDETNEYLQYVDAGTNTLAKELHLETGIQYTDMIAKVVGGSNMLSFGQESNRIGKRNIETVKRVLDDLDIAIDGSDVGGDYGRSVIFHPSDGRVVVKTAGKEVVQL